MAGPLNTPAGPRVRLGLTGGIGSGKSTVARMLETLGAVLIDADAISRNCTAANGAAIPLVRQIFGDGFVTTDGALDRDRMRALVFAQPEARAKLEAIVHPLVRAEIDRQCAAMDGGCAVLDLPLLVESDAWRQRVDTIWVVDCSPETQIHRVMQRNGWPREQVLAVLAAQATREQRLAVADTVIDNDNATLEQLETRVRAAFEDLRHRFGL
ncbi:dephospho-CoA kinase [Hydrogenophaga aquatica]